MSAPIPQTPSLGKVLVVGGCGFLGGHIVSLIVERHPKTQVSVLDLRTSSNRHTSPSVSYYDGDITNLEGTKAIFEKVKPDLVIHTATPGFWSKKEILDSVNVDGTNNLLKASQDTGVKAFVFTSSASVVVSPKYELVNADESWPTVTGKAQPEYYTTTKAYAEAAVIRANRTPSTFLTCALRPAGIFGDGDVTTIPNIVTAYRKGQTKFQVGPNENLFDFTYVGNVAHAHLLAAQALLHSHKILPTIPLDTERVDGEVFFITNGQPTYFWDFARAIWHEAGDRTPTSKVWVLSEDFAWVIGALLENVFWMLGRTPNLDRAKVRYSCMTKYHNIDKARIRLGYEPVVDLHEGIKRGVRFYLDQEKKAAEKKGQ